MGGDIKNVNWSTTGQDALAGAGTGAMIGSAVGPVGTAVGAVVGGVAGAAIGFFGSFFGGESDAQKQADQRAQISFNEGQQELQDLQNPSGAYGQSLDMLKSAALGNTPSAAQIQMNQGVQETMGGAYGLAGAGNGVDPALALRNAMLSAGSSAIAGVSNSAALRATEMANNRQAYFQAQYNNKTLQANILSGQGATTMSANTTLALPGVQSQADIGKGLIGAGINMGGNALANYAKNSGSGGPSYDPTGTAGNMSGPGGAYYSSDAANAALSAQGGGSAPSAASGASTDFSGPAFYE